MILKPPPAGARIVVARSLDFLQRPAGVGADASSIRREMLDECGDTIAATRPVVVAGEAAIRIDLKPEAGGLRSRQVAMMRGGQILFASATAPASEWKATLPVFDDVLASWKWT